MDLNLLDFIIILVFFVSVFLGFKKGLIQEIFWILGVCLGLVLALRYQGPIIRFVENVLRVSFVSNAAAAFLAIFLFVILLFSVFGRLLTFAGKRKKSVKLSNRFGGAFFGLLRAFLLVAFLLIALLKLPLPEAADRAIIGSSLSPFILRHTVRGYENVVSFFPGGKAYLRDVDVTGYISSRKVTRLREIDENIYEKFLNNIIADKQEIIPQQIKKLRKEKEK